MTGLRHSAEGEPESAAGAGIGKRAKPGAERLVHIHNFRGLAIVLIVVTHTLSVFNWSDSPFLIRVLKYALANGTIFFLFISGYLFEHLSGRFAVPAYWKQKARYVVLPYFIVSIPALVLFTSVMRRPEIRQGFYDQPVALQLLEFLVTGSHLAPFWFIPTIVCFYAVAPLILRLTRPDASFWVLPLLFLLPFWLGRSANPALTMLYYLPIWVLGMALCRFRGVLEPRLKAAWPIMLLVAAALAGLEFETTRGTHSVLGYFQKTALILTFFGLLLSWGQGASRWFGLAGTLSFGIFFLHSYFISAGKIVLQKAFGYTPAGSVIGVALASVLAVAVTALVVDFLRQRLGQRSRLVMGV
jgi:peptidoglycan/LPS O-acetylase OafA/YrhL